MSISRHRRRLLILALALIVFFVAYSYIYRSFIDTDKYLQVAWEHTGRDPHVLNWREPAVQVIFRDGRILVHMIYHTDQDREIGPYSFYIDPFKMAVVAEDPRQPIGN
ncbi:MAG: hypothetical protein ACOX1U_05195 [Saccharofermentanales bacterium]|jgi:hypothetical protein|nr:hypothetical protein [Clostridiaceae bacterium]